MLQRYLQSQVLNSLKHFPVVLLTGARQVGKSTLAKELIRSSWKSAYVTLDDRAVLDASLLDPDGFISGTPTPVVIDEVQKAPDLLRAIKKKVDQDRKPGQYLLTGSANIMTLSGVSESLAGRVALHTLHPFCWPEFLKRPVPNLLNKIFEITTSKELIKRLPRGPIKDRRNEIKKLILSGGYPIPALARSGSARHRWFSSYRQTYLERDLLQLKSIENIPDFNRLLSMVAFRTGGLLNLSDLSRETGLPFSTLRRYMNLLEVTYQVFLLHPYFVNIGKRLVKTPKIFLADTGMASYLRGADEWSVLEHQGQAGAVVETWVALELLKTMSALDYRFQLFFWRTHAGQEVDFIVQKGSKLIAIEVKWGQRIYDSDILNLKKCAEDLKGALHFSIILYSGTEIVPFAPGIVAVPFPVFLGV